MSLQNSLEVMLHLTDEEAQEAIRFFLPYTYPKNSILLEMGKEAHQLFFIQDGYVRIHADFEGKEITQWISTPTSFITDLSSWLFHQPARWNFTTLTEVSLLAISKVDYLQLQDKIGNWPSKEKEFIGHCFTQMEQRIFQFLSQNSEERYRAFCKDYAMLFNHVPHQYIASLLGMTPETLSRLRAKLR